MVQKKTLFPAFSSKIQRKACAELFFKKCIISDILGANINQLDNQGNTALMWAVSYGQVRKIKQMKLFNSRFLGKFPKFSKQLFFRGFYDTHLRKIPK